MRTQKTLFFNLSCIAFLLLLSGFQGVNGSSHHDHHKRHPHQKFRHSKLFVFGDSYVDGGNVIRNYTFSWDYPYGITFPGKPTGRYSDGRCFSDFVARFLGLRSPIPYRWRKFAGIRVRYGMNFAYGGTGVFKATSPEPDMTAQIDHFEQMIKDKVYSTEDLRNSVALVSLAGNDYSYYLATNGSIEGFPSFIRSVVNQMTVNLKRIKALGVRKIAVDALPPLGCLPRSTFTTSFTKCNTTQNLLVSIHNELLEQAVAQLNNATSPCTRNSTTFVIIDFEAAFTTVIQNKGAGSIKFENPLKTCCFGITTNDSCGSVDAKTGAKRYTLCDDRRSTFFWDNVHPTQAGWMALYSVLQSNLGQIYAP